MKTFFNWCFCILVSHTCLSQSSNSSLQQIDLNQSEQQDNTYLPYQNFSRAPSYNYYFLSPNGTSITTLQVNVDSLGNNLIGDAANEPSIAVNTLNPNQIVIGWRQFDNIQSNFRQAGYNYSTNGGQTWSGSSKLNSGIFRSDPILDFDNYGSVFYNSLSISPDYSCKLFKSTDGGLSWDQGTDARGGDKAWMAFDKSSGIGSGNLYSSWNGDYSECAPYEFTRSQDNGLTFDSCTDIYDITGWSYVSVGKFGEVYLLGLTSPYADTLLLSRSTNAQLNNSIILWDTTFKIYTGGQYGLSVINRTGLEGQPIIDIDRSNQTDNIYIVAPVSLYDTVNRDLSDVIFYRSIDGGLNWDIPVKINDDASSSYIQWFPTMSVAPNGRIDVIWLDTRKGHGSDSSALFYSYSLDFGTSWSTNEQLSPLFNPAIGYPMQAKMGDYFDMESHNGFAHLSWCATFNGEQDVYYSRITPGLNVGVDSAIRDRVINVFPNPSHGVFSFSSLQAGDEIVVNTISGIHILSQQCFSGQNVIDLTKQPRGLYFAKIYSNGVLVATKKIIIN
jgi:hypothetical protein